MKLTPLRFGDQVTNDIFTREDAEFLTKNAALEEGRYDSYQILLFVLVGEGGTQA